MQKSFRKQCSGGSRFIGGITLLELMIVLVIVGILASVGYPAYLGYANRARRSDGKALLLDAAARMERFYFDNNRYANNTNELGYGAAPVLSAERNYVLTTGVGATGTTNSSFVVNATPNAALPYADPECGVLSLDSRGQQTISGTDTVANCWGR